VQKVHAAWFAEQQYTSPPFTHTLFLCGTCNSLRNLPARDLYCHLLCRNSFAAASLYRTSFTTPYMCWTFNPNFLYCGIFYRNLPLWNFFRTCFTASSLSATSTANSVYRGLRIKTPCSGGAIMLGLGL